MASDRRLRFVYAHVAWMLAVIVILATIDSLTLELFFVLALIGLLIVAELTAPYTVKPAWRSRLTWVILLGLIGFALIVVRRLLEILPPEVMP